MAKDKIKSKCYKGFTLAAAVDCDVNGQYQPRVATRMLNDFYEIYNFESGTITCVYRYGSERPTSSVGIGQTSDEARANFDDIRDHFFPDDAKSRIRNTPI